MDQTETANLIADASPMFADAAYCAAERGEIEEAAHLANVGRARLLSVALKLQSLRLSKQERKHVDTLRASIRSDQAAADGITGEERARSIDRVASHRRELKDILSRSNPGAPESACPMIQRDRIGTIVMPVVTSIGTKLLICAGTTPSWSVVDRPVSDDAAALLIAKFYGLHLGKGMAPAAALRSAQLWMRDATANEINRFATSQKMEARHVVEIAKTVARLRGLMASSASGPPITIPTKADVLKPYAHPYYWGSFTYTGG